MLEKSTTDVVLAVSEHYSLVQERYSTDIGQKFPFHKKSTKYYCFVEFHAVVEFMNLELEHLELLSQVQIIYLALVVALNVASWF